MKYLQYIVLTLFVLVLTNSCIKEDFDDCNNVTIYFQYLADGDKDVLSDYMTKVDLYVFDEGGHIKGVGTYHEDELKKICSYSFVQITTGKEVQSGCSR